MRKLKIAELAKFNGINGAPAYVSINGRVHDVTDSYHWRGGEHWSLHRAGQDLTEELRQAPHGAQLLAGFPVVAHLEDTRG